ncbi:MAG: hypothetical protein HZA84_07420 [Thaumarchaeota archaeon]|nr:hypothetical protein [Nitrososphaerota archaeon]
MKRKKMVRVVDKSSVNYTFSNNISKPTPTNNKQERQEFTRKKDFAKKSIKDLKNQNRHKFNNKNIKSLQGHSPVYE